MMNVVSLSHLVFLVSFCTLFLTEFGSYMMNKLLRLVFIHLLIPFLGHVTYVNYVNSAVVNHTLVCIV